MDPRNLSINDFTYYLPPDRIAEYPLEDRDASRLLIYRNEKISEDIFRNLGAHLPGDSLLVFNNTRVVEARLLFQKPTGGMIEIFCLEPGNNSGDIHRAMQQQGKVLWKCLVGGASKWKKGQILEKVTGGIRLQARYVEKSPAHFIIELNWSPGELSFAGLLQVAGSVPLPPYIKRKAEETDLQRYQTVYAKEEGSVAAPTAGLHFTGDLLDELQQNGMQTTEVTLHVGAGTFQPVKSDTMAEHEMHSEFIEVNTETIRQIAASLEKTIIAVGTTSLRTIESLYWIGVKILEGTFTASEGIAVAQWDAYLPRAKEIPAKQALNALTGWLEKNEMGKLVTATQIMIAPGYSPKIAKALITNFHQPKSTLLLLVAALIGDDWKKVYDYALHKNFRFLSYGDGNLVWFRH